MTILTALEADIYGPNNSRYILDQNDNPISEPDLFKWGTWLQKTDRHVGNDEIDGVRVSTIFVGLNLRYAAEGPPVLWETVIFGGKLNGYRVQYSSKEKALSGHNEACEKVRQEKALH